MVQHLDPNMTWPCPRCRVPQVVTAMYCANCGQPLGAAPPEPPIVEPLPVQSWPSDSRPSRPPGGTATARKRSFPLVLILALVVIVGIVLLSQTGSTPHSGGPAVPKALSDSAIKAAMVENINSFRTSTVAVRRETNGDPDIAVKDAVLIVVTMDPTPSAAARLCRAIASITKSSDTAQPLGIIRVIVISGGAEVIHCSP